MAATLSDEGKGNPHMDGIIETTVGKCLVFCGTWSVQQRKAVINGPISGELKICFSTCLDTV